MSVNTSIKAMHLTSNDNVLIILISLAELGKDVSLDLYIGQQNFFAKLSLVRDRLLWF